MGEAMSILEYIKNQAILSSSQTSNQSTGNGPAEAPSDGKLYLRKNGNWVELTNTNNTFIGPTEPEVPSPYIWYRTDNDGIVIDILQG